MRAITFFAVLWLSCTFAQADLVFDSKEATLNAKVDDLKVEAYYTFENKGKTPVIIKEVFSVCPHCLSAAIKGGTILDPVSFKKGEGSPIRFAAGEKGVVKAVFGIGTFTGTVMKEVKLFIDDDAENAPSVVLKCKVIIPQMVTVEPKSLQWNLGEAPVAKTMKLMVREPNVLNIKKPSMMSKDFDVEFTEVRKGKEYTFKVTPKAGAQQQMVGCYFATDSTNLKFRRVRAYLKIVK